MAVSPTAITTACLARRPTVGLQGSDIFSLTAPAPMEIPRDEMPPPWCIDVLRTGMQGI